MDISCPRRALYRLGPEWSSVAGRLWECDHYSQEWSCSIIEILNPSAGGQPTPRALTCFWSSASCHKPPPISLSPKSSLRLGWKATRFYFCSPADNVMITTNSSSPHHWRPTECGLYPVRWGLRRACAHTGFLVADSARLSCPGFLLVLAPCPVCAS